MQAIVSDATASCITYGRAIQRLKEIGVNEQEVHDYIEQLTEQAEHERDCEPSPVLSNEGGEEHDKDGPQLVENPADALAWAIIQQKLIGLQQVGRSHVGADFSFDELFKALGLSLASFGIPQSILTAVPHLAATSPASQGSHLAESFHLCQLDPILDLMQQQRMQVPDVLMDQYVNFKKLFASMEPKDLTAGFAIIKKDHSSPWWIRVFGAWAEVVLHLYPHCSAELDAYHTVILELFHAMAFDPSIAIRVDRAARDAYHKSPFHLDDCPHLQVHILADIMQSSSQTTLGKRAHPEPSSSPSKWATT
ncbi:uncharacterized protein LAESUDRAFT_735695 [Laetiporus sulphureus 93-53]|uniref:Uncharacterized protein n=1 Tax=Laetiporus sulphureus 93-53 TaxID=1314785 RepID=A0A165FIS1_9APHY|nr:uncharacterized protein LAESUDRAFT_735695 [Laetiporus sulphureus 93-53]KZT09033.1 hypothetical protein LAESUDRAFT_735695 [Laetiporus sulphureus 93-53]